MLLGLVYVIVYSHISVISDTKAYKNQFQFMSDIPIHEYFQDELFYFILNSKIELQILLLWIFYVSFWAYAGICSDECEICNGWCRSFLGIIDGNLFKFLLIFRSLNWNFVKIDGIFQKLLYYSLLSVKIAQWGISSINSHKLYVKSPWW